LEIDRTGEKHQPSNRCWSRTIGLCTLYFGINRQAKSSYDANRQFGEFIEMQDYQFKNRKRRVLQFATFTFDVSFQEIFSTICYGDTLYLIDEDCRRDANELLKEINKYRITHLFIPSIVLQNLSEVVSLSDNSFFLETVIVAGETIKNYRNHSRIYRKKWYMPNQSVWSKQKHML